MLRRFVALSLVSSLALAGGPVGCATRSGEGPAPRSPAEGPPPFATAPEFSLPDSTGQPRRLAELMGPKGLVLVVYRGHW